MLDVRHDGNFIREVEAFRMKLEGREPSPGPDTGEPPSPHLVEVEREGDLDIDSAMSRSIADLCRSAMVRRGPQWVRSAIALV